MNRKSHLFELLGHSKCLLLSNNLFVDAYDTGVFADVPMGECIPFSLVDQTLKIGVEAEVGWNFDLQIGSKKLQKSREK